VRRVVPQQLKQQPEVDFIMMLQKRGNQVLNIPP